MKTLSNYEIIDLAKQYNIPLKGIYSRDNIPLKLKEGYYIINLDRKNGVGTHWTAFHYGKYNFYFDAFGFDAPNVLSKRLGKYDYSDMDIQSIHSNSCGWFCLYFINYCNQNGNNIDAFVSFLNQFSNHDTTINEHILENNF